MNQKNFSVFFQGCVLSEQIFIMHGGLFSDSEITIQRLNAIDRFKEPSDVKMLLIHFEIKSSETEIIPSGEDIYTQKVSK